MLMITLLIIILWMKCSYSCCKGSNPYPKVMVVNGSMIRNEQGEQFRKPSITSAAAACSSHSNDTIQEREKILMK